ncbi:hypothetical protein DYBT9275_02513 [Dyadobacter sp. CECT 9275]|uniref:FecR family protein n=1 Tax=Dyadobacter helix TaxID=2822344 RepID=A0A916JE99_9BACT|nr:FecR domain-containing protein [Dyadobacter sp. CECT 9275]CAG5000690.1 hypothetical protein DYBT9275_02513 [Dyadobacter sp. CECT 9275]
MDKFSYLLQRYIDQVATPQELEEFFNLVQSKQYDHLLDHELSEALQAELQIPSEMDEKLMMDKIYSGKIREKIQPRLFSNTDARKRPVWRIIAAAAAVSGILFYGWLFFRKSGASEGVVADSQGFSNSPQTKSMAKYSDTQLVKLPDGSTVLLNQGSELSYSPADFGAENREVWLNGEGFFDVKHDAAKPFRVKTGKFLTTVLGTAFNIRSFSNESEIKVTVTRGKVKVGDDHKTYEMLAPDEQLVVNTNTSDFVKTSIKAETVTEWKDKFLVMDNVTMHEAIQMMSQKFGVKFTLQNKALTDCHITATFFNNEELDHVLQVISAVNQLSYSVEPGGDIILTGGEQCK